MSGRTWKSLSSDSLQQIRLNLLDTGGTEVEAKHSSEIWRIRVDDSVFIAFRNGTLYHTPSNSNSIQVAEAARLIDSLGGAGYIPPDKDLLIGLDETGKGEIAGPVVLVGVIFPKSIFHDIVKIIGAADTKKQHRLAYWEELFTKLTEQRRKGFYFAAEKISPHLFDKYNINRLLDLFYARIIRRLRRGASGESCRIVIDDYGAVGLKNSGLLETNNENEVVIVPRAEDQYIEAKAASIIAKRIRETILHHVNQLPQYRIDGLSVGTGNVGNETTLQWLKKWNAAGKPFPWFIKRSFKTITELSGDSLGKKATPELKTELLPPEFLQAFQHAGVAPKHLTSIKCSNCRQRQQTVVYSARLGAPIRCEECQASINDLQLTLRYYCGAILIDDSIISTRALLSDLEGSALFENYRVIIPWSDSSKNDPNFMAGVQELKILEQLGRLDLRYIKLDLSSQDDLYSLLAEKAIEQRSVIATSDEKLVERAKEASLFSIRFAD